MTAIFPREAEHWAEGDLAYCVSSHVPPECTARLEKGRIYRVAMARKPSNIAHHAIRLEGFGWDSPLDFIWSNRFVRIGAPGGRLRAIMDAIEYSPMHYWPNCAQFRSGNRHWRKRAQAMSAGTAKTEGLGASARQRGG